MNVQDAKNLTITEGNVKTIHDKDNQLLWGAVGYDTKYAGDTSQQTYSGKNLYLLPEGTFTALGITWTKANNVATGVGTATSTFSNLNNHVELATPLPAGTYTLSISTPLYCNLDLRLRETQNSSTKSFSIRAGDTSVSFTTDFTATWGSLALGIGVQVGDEINVSFAVWLEAGSTATSYEPYVGGVPAPNPDYPQEIQTVTGVQTLTVSDGTNTATYTINLGTTELCKIGDYQDYIYKSSGDWYVHKEIRKRVLDGTENWTNTGVISGNRYFMFNTGDAILNSDSGVLAISDKFIGRFGSDNNSIMLSANSSTPGRMLIFWNDAGTTTTNWKTWLSSNNVTTYYVLATATDTKITDQTLIGQLELVNQWTTRYGYTESVQGNLPIILSKTTI